MPEKNHNLTSCGEQGIIEDILALLPSAPDVTIPPGDDCAAVALAPDQDELLLTSDPVFAGIHFDDSASTHQIGHKAAGRVLSDLAAMGAKPRWVLLNIAAPACAPSADLVSIVKGAQNLCSAFGVSVVGGDVTHASILSVNAFGCGTAPAGSAIPRSGAQCGDVIYVTGQLGNSRAGKHLTFTPRVAEGLWLRENGYASSMIDISDGLATDLRHILKASKAGAEIQISSIPIALSLHAASAQDGIAHALCDGEDFELLFTVPQEKSHALKDAWQAEFAPISPIGTVTENEGAIVQLAEDGSASEMTARGYDHFA